MSIIGAQEVFVAPSRRRRQKQDSLPQSHHHTRSEFCLCLEIQGRCIHHRLGVSHLSPLGHLPAVLEALPQEEGDRGRPGGV